MLFAVKEKGGGCNSKGEGGAVILKEKGGGCNSKREGGGEL